MVLKTENSAQLAQEIQVLLYDQSSGASSPTKVCLSQLNKESFCLISEGHVIFIERINDFAVFQTCLKQALQQLKAANAGDAYPQTPFSIQGFAFPVDATIEEFCDADDQFEVTMTFSPHHGLPARWLCINQRALETLIGKF